MKKTCIFIVVDANNRNIVYPAAIASVKSEITKYFGMKNVEPDIPEYPTVSIKCEVTQDDINIIKKTIDCDSISLLAIIGMEAAKGVKGDIIDLTEA